MSKPHPANRRDHPDQAPPGQPHKAEEPMGALLGRAPEPAASPTLSPNDHVKLIVEMLRQGTAELSRRWLAALLLAPASEREEIVRAVEERMTRMYAPVPSAAARHRQEQHEDEHGREVRVMLPPRDRGGYVEQIIRTYEVAKESKKKVGKARKKA